MNVHAFILNSNPHLFEQIFTPLVYCVPTQTLEIICFNDSFSDLVDVGCGVPQGLMVDPILFLLFINNNIGARPRPDFVLFADE